MCVRRMVFLVLTLLVVAGGGFSTSQPAHAQEEPVITVDEAIQIATAYIGGGTVEEVQLERFLDILVYEVEFVENPEVTVNAQNGSIMRVKRSSVSASNRGDDDRSNDADRDDDGRDDSDDGDDGRRDDDDRDDDGRDDSDDGDDGRDDDGRDDSDDGDDGRDDRDDDGDDGDDDNDGDD